MNLQEAAAEMGSSSSSRSGLHGLAIDESKKAREFDDQKDQDCSQDNDVSNKVGPDGGNDEKNNFQYPYTSVKQKDTMQDEQLQYTRAKMGEVREENQRLKVYLDRIMKDYQTLQMHFCAIVQQEVKETRDSHQQVEKPDHQLVSLSLGRMPSSSSADSKHKIPTTKKEADHQQDIIGEGLSLGMDPKCLSSPRGLIRQPLRNRSPAGNSSGGELNGVAAGAENWPPTKNLKTMRAGDDEASQQSYLNKKPRVSVRARCDAPTLNDGCQWRKYGQKIAKGNPCPRAYYRCTVAPSCPVRKQVQRCAEDMSILITTYEGTHNHPLPMAATAMASTTSAAACMLMSGSSSSTSQPGGDATGLNFYVSSDPTSSRLKQLHIANPSISSSSSHPTITLDLTSSSSSHNFSNPISSSNLSYPPRFNIINNSSTSQLNFNSPSEANANQISWLGQPFSKRPRMTQDNYLYHSFSQRIGNTSNNPPPQQQSMLPEPLVAATKVITSDPGFQSALVAALTSLMGNGGENFGQKPKWEASSDYFPDANASTYESTSNSRMPLVGAGSSGGLMFFPRSSLPFASTNKSSDRSASPPNPKNSTS